MTTVRTEGTIKDLKALREAELVPLCKGTWRLARVPHRRVTPAGTRVLVEMSEGRIEGDRLSGRAVGAMTGDWFLIGRDGTGPIDFRGTLETDDEATIYMYGMGRVDKRAAVYDGSLADLTRHPSRPLESG